MKMNCNPLRFTPVVLSFLLLASPAKADVIFGANLGFGGLKGKSVRDVGGRDHAESTGDVALGAGVQAGVSTLNDTVRVYYEYDNYAAVLSSLSSGNHREENATIELHTLNADYFFKEGGGFSIGRPFVGAHLGYGVVDTHIQGNNFAKTQGTTFGLKLGSAITLGRVDLQAGLKYSWLPGHAADGEFGGGIKRVNWDSLGQVFGAVTFRI